MLERYKFTMTRIWTLDLTVALVEHSTIVPRFRYNTESFVQDLHSSISNEEHVFKIY